MNSAILLSPDLFKSPYTLSNKETEKQNSYSISFIAAITFHLLVLAFGGAAIIQAPEYGIDFGQGGIEVQLVAAPAELSTSKVSELKNLDQSHPSSEIEEQMTSEMTIPIEEKKTLSQITQSENLPQRLEALNSPHHGDGSSPIPGMDTTTFYSEGGATMLGKEGHLRNPAPYYPQEAIDQNQEGLVLINILVNREGRVAQIQLKQSSGIYSLDRSALQTLKKWKFSPGKIGFLARETWVTVPIRFRLEDVKK